MMPVLRFPGRQAAVRISPNIIGVTVAAMSLFVCVLYSYVNIVHVYFISTKIDAMQYLYTFYIVCLYCSRMTMCCFCQVRSVCPYMVGGHGLVPLQNSEMIQKCYTLLYPPHRRRYSGQSILGRNM